MGFSKYKLHENILKALEDAGYSEATEIQDRTFEAVLAGKDIIASAKTGSGKTGAFLIPTIHNIINNPRKKASGKKQGARILILTPTRELAAQITTQADKYSKYDNSIKNVCVVGGVPYFKQQSKLARKHDILIATPGRLIDYMKRGTVDFSQIDTVVLDEADRMLDMGFSESVEEILESTPEDRQTLLFSATLDKSILNLSKKFLKTPEEIFVNKGHEKNENITTILHYVDNLTHKNDLLNHILNAEDITQAIIFTSTKRHCDELCDELMDKGFLANAIHGDMNQRQRTRTLKKLQENKIQYLVATDVAARGIDVPAISHVINFDLPRDPEDFIHRIGRTARAGRKGTAISFVGPKDVPLVPRIENFTKQTLEVAEIAGLEPKNCKPYSKQDGSSSRRGKSGGRRSSGGRGRDSRSSGGRREGGGSRSFGGRDGGRREGGGSRSFGSRDDRRDSRSSGSRDGGESRSFGSRDDRRDSRSSGGRSDGGGSRSFGSRDGGRDSRSSGSRDAGGSRSFGSRDDRRDSRSSGGRSDGGGSRSFGSRDGGRDSRSSGGRSDGGGSRSFGSRDGGRDSRSSGGRSDGGGSRSFGSRDGGRDSRSFGGRSDGGGSRSFGSRDGGRDSRSSGGRSDGGGSRSFGGRSDGGSSRGKSSFTKPGQSKNYRTSKTRNSR